MNTPSPSDDAPSIHVPRQGTVKVQDFLRFGRDLLAAKAALRHGQFNAWLKARGISSSRASRAMHAAKRLTGDEKLLDAVPSISVLVELLALEDDQLNDLLQNCGTGELRLGAVARGRVARIRALVKGERRRKQAPTHRPEGQEQRPQSADGQEQLDRWRSELANGESVSAMRTKLRAGCGWVAPSTPESGAGPAAAPSGLPPPSSASRLRHPGATDPGLVGQLEHELLHLFRALDPEGQASVRLHLAVLAKAQVGQSAAALARWRKG